jgi:hypothetical protein
MAIWDEDMEVDEGTAGIYLFDPQDPGAGAPRFASAAEKAAGGDALETHMSEMGRALKRAKIPRRYR